MTAPIRTKGNNIIRHVLTGCKTRTRPGRHETPFPASRGIRAAYRSRRGSCRGNNGSSAMLCNKPRQVDRFGTPPGETPSIPSLELGLSAGPVDRERMGKWGSVRLSTNSASFAMEPLALFRNRQHDSHSSILINSQLLGYGPLYIVIAAPMGYSTAAPLRVA